jgi:diaminopimelate epimerase
MFFFSKMQATGNDFVVINYLENRLEYSFKLLAEFLCNRHFGVGADGILIIEESKVADFKMRIFNQDGSEAEMCGNGIRCFAKFVYEKNLIHKKEFKIETLAGVKDVSLLVEGKTVTSVEVNMGKPIFDLRKIPVIDLENKNAEKIKIENFEGYPVSIGNPHCVCFVEDLDKIDIEKCGKMIENYKCFPNKTNVEFVQIINEKNIKMRVWERGVGETLACGTGTCAASVISNKYKSTNSRLTVDLLGGKLQTNYENDEIKLIGPAEFVFEGKINI